jgi:hypothetical protein
MQNFMMQPLRVKKSTIITEGKLADDITDYYAHVRLQTTREIESDDEQIVYEDDEEMTEEELDALDELTNPDANTTIH